ncbi:MAG: M1 family metallopeptidase [Ilumatobacteraceae bacterium]
MNENAYRLSRAVLPVRYELVLEPDLADASFAGTVRIDAVAHDTVDHIELNADELDITAVRVDGTAVAYSLDASSERLRISASVEPGDVRLEIEFTGTLNDKLRGFYRSTFTDESGAEQVIAATQMQTTDCRRAFPCWDEPDFKAVYDVTLVIEPHLLALSNGAEVERTIGAAGKHVVRFATTMPMSTYLVAFVVGPLEATDPVMVPKLGGGEIPLRLVHVPGKSHLTSFGLDVGAFAIDWFQTYYGIAYPTDKCDMVALPDFAAGAMENLGLITYRENLLLCDTATSTQAEQQNVADVITHELAHMWFGDLVTMRWWNGIWLNEAFATFMEILCCDAFRPDWKRWTTFSLERSVAFDTDALVTTRPVEFPVTKPDECAGMFDVLTYQKGGALLRMLEQYLGPDEFRNGVSHYLTTHAYGNTETGDLWDAIEAVNPGTPVRRMMDSWIWQPGHPLIGARVEGSTLVLSQQRFSFDEAALGTAAATVFVVPVHLRNGDAEWKVLLDTEALTVTLPHPDEPVQVNAGGHGFVRVAYSDELLARIEGPMLASLGIIDRYALVDDAWNAVVAGRLGTVELLAFLDEFGDERDLAVWQIIGVALRGIGRLVDGDAYAAFQRRVRTLVGPVMADLGWEPHAGEDDLTAKLRGVIVGMLGVLGDDPETQQRCRDIVAAPAGVHPELVAAAVNVVAAVGDERDFDRFLAEFRTASTPQEQLRAMFALAEFPSAELVQRALDLALSGEVKTQNAPFLLARCIANRQQGRMAWDFVRRHWDRTTAVFPDNTIVRMIDPVRLLTEPEVVADVQSFFSEHPIPQSAKTLEQVLERQRVNAALRSREGTRLGESLAT